MKRIRFHPVYLMRYIKYALAFSVIPMLALIADPDWSIFWRALFQDVLILLFMAGLAVVFWMVTGVVWDEESIHVWGGVIRRMHRRFPKEHISAVHIERPLRCRALGASILTLYFKNGKYPKKCSIYLSKKNANLLRDSVFGNEQQAGAPSVSHSHTVKEQLVFTVLSANLVSTLLLGVAVGTQIYSSLGDAAAALREWTLEQYFGFEQLFELVLPGGAAVLLSLIFLLAVFTMVRSFLRAARYEVERQGNLLVQHSGMWVRNEVTLRVDCITLYDLRTTPFSRLMRWRPMDVHAGSYTGSGIPLLICRKGREGELQGLLPEYRPPRERASLVNTAYKSIWGYVWLSGALSIFFFLVLLTGRRISPNFVPALWLPVLLCLGSLLVHTEAYFYEGFARRGPGAELCAARHFTRHHIYAPGVPMGLRMVEHPISQLFGRCTLYVYLPSKQRYRIRGMSLLTARLVGLS